MIMQLLAGAGIIEVDYSVKEDRALFSGAQKRENLRRRPCAPGQTLTAGPSLGENGSLQFSP